MNRSIPSRKARLALLAVAFFVTSVVAARPAEAQVIYTYVGNGFTHFTCSATDPSVTCTTPSPTSPFTTANHLTITITVTNPLPSNATMFTSELMFLPGFLINMTDGIRSLTFGLGYDGADYAEGQGFYIVTDAAGGIINWGLLLGGAVASGGMESHLEVNQSGTFAWDCVWFSHPDGAFDQACNGLQPGTWTVQGIGGPEDFVQDLIDLLPTLGLTQGQVNSLTTKLTNILNSINAGDDNQAINQLEAFKNQVQAAKIPASTAQQLIDAADAIIAMLNQSPAP
jgi:hypothetical protein